MVKKVILWANGMVMVFDQAGRPVGDFQGHFSECLLDVLDAAAPDAEFAIGDWDHGTVRTSKECLKNFCNFNIGRRAQGDHCMKAPSCFGLDKVSCTCGCANCLIARRIENSLKRHG